MDQLIENGDAIIGLSTLNGSQSRWIWVVKDNQVAGPCVCESNNLRQYQINENFRIPFNLTKILRK